MPKMAYSTGLTPRPTDAFLLKAALAVQHGTIDPEDLEGVAEVPSLPDDLSDAERALLRVHDACEHLEGDSALAREVAEEALALDSGCPDALVLLWSLESQESDAALALARRAHESARERIEQLPHWREGIDDLYRGDPGCRGLVRAHCALALSLWARGDRHDAIGIAARVIGLNPTDNMGMRWHLVNWYLIQGMVRKAYRLLRDYPGERIGAALSAAALVEYLRSGPGDAARKALRGLAELNMPLLMEITGDRRPDPCPEYVDMFVPGEVTELAVWGRLLWHTWDAHPEAKEWLGNVKAERGYIELATSAIAAMAEQIGLSEGIDGKTLLSEILRDPDRRIP